MLLLLPLLPAAAAAVTACECTRVFLHPIPLCFWPLHNCSPSLLRCTHTCVRSTNRLCTRLFLFLSARNVNIRVCVCACRRDASGVHNGAYASYVTFYFQEGGTGVPTMVQIARTKGPENKIPSALRSAHHYAR